MKDWKFIKIGNEATGPNWDKKAGNESINKQEWSMFKGLSKDAEKVGNADTVSEYNAEIQRLTKKAEQLRRMGQGRLAMEIEKQIEKLGKELRELGNKKIGNAMNKKVKNSSVREYKDSQGRIAQIDFNSDGTDADMAIYEDERMLKSVEQRNFSTIRDAEQYVQSHGFRRVG